MQIIVHKLLCLKLTRKEKKVEDTKEGYCS